MLSSVGAWLGAYWLVSLLMAYSKWIPDIMEQTFDNILSTPLGIFSIAVVGPVVEELLFRRAVTDALLKQYSEQRAIVVSALIFGLFHINPAQIVPAFLMGILFAWIYCRTRSLIPTIVVHILSNSLSVYFLTRPNPIEDITQLFSAGSTIAITVASAALLFFSIKCIVKSK
jgi:membrane protease YdiL (CAAX protease family)